MTALKGLDVLSAGFEGVIFAGMHFITVIKTRLCNSMVMRESRQTNVQACLYHDAFDLIRLWKKKKKKGGMFGCQRKAAAVFGTLAQQVKVILFTNRASTRPAGGAVSLTRGHLPVREIFFFGQLGDFFRDIERLFHRPTPTLKSNERLFPSLWETLVPIEVT